MLLKASIGLSKSSLIPHDSLLSVIKDVLVFIPQIIYLKRLSSGALVRIERLNKSFFLVLGELTYYWLDNKGNYYSEGAFNTLCHQYGYEIIDPGHRVFH